MANGTSAREFDYDNQPQLFGHPVGLYVLFFTELWERFSYYGMRAILTLYMIAKTTDEFPGLGWDTVAAFSLYGWYTMLVYVASIPGGVLADKYIGQKKSVMLGGWLLVVGHSILAIDATWAFFTGLGFIIAGVGCLKPNVSTMVGGLYRQGDPRRDQGFTVFYIGINIGAFLSSIIVGIVANAYGWHYGFGLAGIGMAIGQIFFLFGQRYLKGVGEAPRTSSSGDSEEETSSLGVLLSNLFKSPLQLGITVVLAIVGVTGFLLGTDGYDRVGYTLLWIFISLTIGMLMMIYKEINKEEKDRFLVLLLAFLIVIVFWGAFEQAGGLMNVYTLTKIDREVSMLFLDVLFLGAGGFLAARGVLHFIRKKQTGYIYMPIGITLIVLYLILKGRGVISNPYEIPAAVFQSVNAMFIIIFGTLVGGFWIWWKKKGGETSSLFKMAVGTIIMGIGFVFMAKASVDIQNYGDKAALILLILAYLFHTIGELCASPVAMSFITKIAPVKYVSIMMGVYFAATGFGNKVAGVIGELSQTPPVKIELAASTDEIDDYVTLEDGLLPPNFEIVGDIYAQNDEVKITKEGDDLKTLLSIGTENAELLKGYVQSMPNSEAEPLTVVIMLEKPKGSEQYSGTIKVFEVQDNQELWTFLSIVIFTIAFGVLLILFLKPLKRMTHGAEETSLKDK